MKMQTTLMLGLLAFAGSAAAANLNPALIDVQTGKVRPAPEKLDMDSYLEWAQPILKPNASTNYTSAFTPAIFEWYNEERERGLPEGATNGGVVINVERPLAQTIELEEAGEIEEGNTVGAEVYAEMDGTAEQALEAMLFRWGKPVGKMEGDTFPTANPFARRRDYFAPNSDWGPNGFASLTMRRDGGIVKDIHDRYLVLVHGDKDRGYDVLMQYIKPGGTTLTKQCLAIALIRPLPNGKASYKLTTRFQGQSYKVLGNVSIGRKNIGFNPEKVKAIQTDYTSQLKELRDTGTIKDKKTDIEFGK